MLWSQLSLGNTGRVSGKGLKTYFRSTTLCPKSNAKDWSANYLPGNNWDLLDTDQSDTLSVKIPQRISGDQKTSGCIWQSRRRIAKGPVLGKFHASALQSRNVGCLRMGSKHLKEGQNNLNLYMQIIPYVAFIVKQGKHARLLSRLHNNRFVSLLVIYWTFFACFMRSAHSASFKIY